MLRPARAFPSTHWSVVLDARHRSERSREALATLCEIYWYPVYAFLRRRGYSPDDAQDLTQEFFASVLERRTLDRADPARGRFRSFLLASLKNFAANESEKARACKRGGAVSITPLELGDAEHRYQLEPPDDLTPERLYDRRWALALLDRVLQRLRLEFVAAGRGFMFDHLKTYLTGDNGRPAHAETATVLSMSEGAVKIAVHRLRRRYRDLLRDEIAHTVATPQEIEGEIRSLFSALSMERRPSMGAAVRFESSIG